MRSFLSSEWTQLQIDEQLKMFGVLVVFAFEPTFFGPEVKVIVHGLRMSEYDKMSLKDEISQQYGGDPLSQKVCVGINELARKWYNKNILKLKARVVNKKRIKE